VHEAGLVGEAPQGVAEDRRPFGCTTPRLICLSSRPRFSCPWLGAVAMKIARATRRVAA